MILDDESEPMPVIRIKTKNGTRIIPELDHGWSDHKQLRWLAGVAGEDSGLHIRVAVTDRGTYCISYGSSGLGDRPFRDAWSTITHLSIGYALGRRHALRAE